MYRAVKIYLQNCKPAKDTKKCNLTKLYTAFPASNNLQNWCHIELDITSFYDNVHSKLSLVFMLKDHVPLLNLSNLDWFCYRFLFGVYCLTIIKIGDTTNALYKPRFHANWSRDRF